MNHCNVNKDIENPLQTASILKKNPVFKVFLKKISSHSRAGAKYKVWCSNLENYDL